MNRQLTLVMVVLALAAAVTAGEVADWRQLVAAGAPASTVLAAYFASGQGALLPAEAVTFWGQGVPLTVLARLMDPGGSGQPQLAEADGHLVLAYTGYRIIGYAGADGPRLVVTGYDDSGQRLAPPVVDPQLSTNVPRPSAAADPPDPARPLTVVVVSGQPCCSQDVEPARPTWSPPAA